MSSPNLDFETSLLETYRSVIGVDEVGRGALAGPVAVGAFSLMPALLDGMPTSLRDSKLVPEKSVQRWRLKLLLGAKGLSDTPQLRLLNLLE